MSVDQTYSVNGDHFLQFKATGDSDSPDNVSTDGMLNVLGHLVNELNLISVERDQINLQEKKHEAKLEATPPGSPVADTIKH